MLSTYQSSPQVYTAFTFIIWSFNQLFWCLHTAEGKRSLTFLRIEHSLSTGFSGFFFQHSRISLSTKYLQYNRNGVDTLCNFLTASYEKDISSKLFPPSCASITPHNDGSKLYASVQHWGNSQLWDTVSKIQTTTLHQIQVSAKNNALEVSETNSAHDPSVLLVHLSSRKFMFPLTY